MVNRTLAENMWGDASPLGKSIAISFANDRVFAVVGVATDAHLSAFDHVAPVVHIPPLTLPVLVAKTTKNVDAQLKQLVASVDPELVVAVVPLSQPFEQTVKQARAWGRRWLAGWQQSPLLAIVGSFSVFAYLAEDAYRSTELPRRALVIPMRRSSVTSGSNHMREVVPQRRP